MGNVKLYSTLSRQVEDFTPLQGNSVKMYTCGLTVYDQPHIGNWLGYIYWDVLIRVLKASGYNVTRVQNITDVGHLTSDEDTGDDKLEKGAEREGITAWDVAEKYIKIAEHEGYDLLYLEKPDHMPRATKYIDQQIQFVKELESRGYTYILKNDGVYFDTSKLSDYGKLARLDIEGLKPGARVPADGKQNVTDFALWKFTHKETKRDMEWDSPWGKGFPGWHLECSTMARELLGDQIDIHTGGIDHIPVHHTNEIAQTESVTNKPFSQIWMHNNHIKVNGTKISKSLGNGYTLQDILNKGYSLEAYKLMVLSKHYRTEGNFTWEILDAAQNRLHQWHTFADLKYQYSPDAQLLGEQYFANKEVAILSALQNDLNTPLVLSIIDETIDYIARFGRGVHEKHSKDFESFLRTIDSYLGLKLSTRADIDSGQKQLIQERETARLAKDWQKSDEIRNELKRQNIDVKDTDHKTIWSRI
jgi:cysteinyl-tRNA synthetase